MIHDHIYLATWIWFLLVIVGGALFYLVGKQHHARQLEHANDTIRAVAGVGTIEDTDEPIDAYFEKYPKENHV